MTTIKCAVCGKETDNSDYRREEGDLLDTHCHGCSFWTRKINNLNSRVAIIDGTHYTIGSENTGSFRGFGGRHFIILFHDGRRVETNNLWCQGHIDEPFKAALPDNAIFEDDDEHAALVVDGDIPF